MAFPEKTLPCAVFFVEVAREGLGDVVAAGDGNESRFCASGFECECFAFLRGDGGKFFSEFFGGEKRSRCERFRIGNVPGSRKRPAVFGGIVDVD